MREHRLSLPQLALIVATRGIAAFGAGLLLSGKFGKHRRKLVGWSMLGAGALSTIPIAIRLFKRSEVVTPNGKRRDTAVAATT